MVVITEKHLIAMAPLPMGLLMLPLVRSAGDNPGHLAGAVAGWMLLLLIVQSVAAIMAGVLCRSFRAGVAVTILSGLSAASAAAVGCSTGLIPTMVVWPA
ncbi:MAG: hypothetical protein ACP5I8_15740, partial [Phycisphaerae bacterium]